MLLELLDPAGLEGPVGRFGSLDRVQDQHENKLTKSNLSCFQSRQNVTTEKGKAQS